MGQYVQKTEAWALANGSRSMASPLWTPHFGAHEMFIRCLVFTRFRRERRATVSPPLYENHLCDRLGPEALLLLFMTYCRTCNTFIHMCKNFAREVEERREEVPTIFFE